MKRAFTLIELSIVLIIIGLLVGGILAGQELVAQAKLRAVTSEMQRYQLAIRTFDLKYGDLPGDMDYATDFWGSAVRDGDGDGHVEWNNGREELQLWAQLGLAGMIEGQYTGNTVSGATNVLGENVPVSAITGGGYAIQSQTVSAVGNASYGSLFGIMDENLLILASIDSTGNIQGAIISPIDASTIDTKIDDGRPDRGKILAGRGALGPSTCTTDQVTAASADYQLTVSEPTCRMYYIIEH